MGADLLVKCRAPLVWLLAPIILGYILGRYTARYEASLFLCISGTVLALIGLWLAYTEKKNLHLLWAIFFLTAGTFISWSYFNHRLERFSSAWLQLPIREAKLTLSGERIYHDSDRFGQISGLARVIHAPKHLSDLEGQRIYFQLRAKDKNSPLIRSSIFRSRGILSFINEESLNSEFEEYLHRIGVFFILKRGRITEVLDSGNPFYRLCLNASHFFQSILEEGSSPQSEMASVYTAMLLGKKDVLTRDQKNRFQISGTMHFFAVSGLHVGVIALTLNYILIFLRLNYHTRVVIGLLILFLYVEITGASPSAVRAFIMVALFWSSQLLFRQPSPFASLLASGLIVLIINPWQLWSAGFQFSYAVVAGILLYGLPLMERINRRLVLFTGLPEMSHRWYHRLSNQVLHSLSGLFAISLSASLISSPLTIYYFNLFNPGAIILNMFLVTIATLIIINGVISLIFGLLQLTAISAFFNHGTWLLIWLINKSIEFSVQIPGFYGRIMFREDFWGPVTLLILLAILLITHSKKYINSRIAYWLPPAILLLIIFFGTIPIN